MIDKPRIAFTGGRSPSVGVLEAVHECCQDIYENHQPSEIRVGDAGGVDEAVRTFWEGKAKVRKFVADWERYGKQGGPIRNREILRDADVLVFFPGGRGTADCTNQAEKLGIELRSGLAWAYDEACWRWPIAKLARHLDLAPELPQGHNEDSHERICECPNCGTFHCWLNIKLGTYYCFECRRHGGPAHLVKDKLSLGSLREAIQWLRRER